MSINATLLAQIVVFGILIWFTMKFLWPPIAQAMDERAHRIAEGLSAAERARKELADADTRAAEEVRQARTEAAAIIERANQQAAQIVEKAKQDAQTEAGRQKAAALAEIDSMADRAREDLRRQVASLAVAGASRILHREIDAGTHKALIDELVTEI